MKFVIVHILFVAMLFSCSGIAVKDPACGDGKCDEDAGESLETCPCDCVPVMEGRVAVAAIDHEQCGKTLFCNK